MTRFTFKLEPLLKVRRAEERRHQVAVAEVANRIHALEEEIRRGQAQIAVARDELRSGLTGTLHAHELRMHATAALQHLRRTQRLLPDLAANHRELEAVRADLVEAARRRRAIELLREQRYERWKGEQQKLENAALDELAGRKRLMGGDGGMSGLRTRSTES